MLPTDEELIKFEFVNLPELKIDGSIEDPYHKLPKILTYIYECKELKIREIGISHLVLEFKPHSNVTVTIYFWDYNNGEYEVYTRALNDYVISLDDHNLSTFVRNPYIDGVMYLPDFKEILC